MQSKESIERFYKRDDPWGYETNSDDQKRKNIILNFLKEYGVFNKALDIGCGQGFITRDLPAKEIYGYEISDTAKSRLPKNIIPIKEINDKYDLIIATGVLYKHYPYQEFLNIIKRSAIGIVLTCNIKNWEKNDLNNEVKKYEFKYREYIERLAIYDFSST